MWKEIDNTEAVRALYKDKMPSFFDVNIVECTIITGEDIEIHLKFDTDEMPNNLPQKWTDRKVNTVQFIIGCLCVEFVHLDLNNGVHHNMRLSIGKEVNEKKYVRIFNNQGEIKMSLFSRWIYIRSISGYHRDVL